MGKEDICTVDTGLANVPVCTSDISHTAVDRDGNPILLYRGYSIYDLVQIGEREKEQIDLNARDDCQGYMV